MNETIQHEVAVSEVMRERSQGWPDLENSWAVFRWVVAGTAAWFLLKELAPILRPLCLAILVTYVVLPVHVYVTGKARAGVGSLLLLIGVGCILLLLVFATYRDIADLTDQLPQMHERAQQLTGRATSYVERRLPWLTDGITGTASAEKQLAGRLREGLESVVNFTAGASLEALQVVVFVLLILLEAPRVPARVCAAFPDQKAQQILEMFRNASAAIARYLKVKVKANLALAVPAMLVLWAFGVPYVILWGVLTFLANFIPYLGSLIACGLPLVFAFLKLDFGWQPIAAGLLLIAVHVTSAYLVEPAMTGKAVNLSPLIVLLALSFWSLCWGLTGMVLAVPLTMMFKIVMESAPSTRPVAMLMEEA